MIHKFCILSLWLLFLLYFLHDFRWDIPVKSTITLSEKTTKIKIQQITESRNCVWDDTSWTRTAHQTADNWHKTAGVWWQTAGIHSRPQKIQLRYSYVIYVCELQCNHLSGCFFQTFSPIINDHFLQHFDSVLYLNEKSIPFKTHDSSLDIRTEDSRMIS